VGAVAVLSLFDFCLINNLSLFFLKLSAHSGRIPQQMSGPRLAAARAFPVVTLMWLREGKKTLIRAVFPH
jgi:hypothetical protein